MRERRAVALAVPFGGWRGVALGGRQFLSKVTNRVLERATNHRVEAAWGAWSEAVSVAKKRREVSKPPKALDT